MNQKTSSKIAENKRTAYVRPRLWLLLSIATKANNPIATFISETPLYKAPNDPTNPQAIFKHRNITSINYHINTQISKLLVIMYLAATQVSNYTH